MLRNQVKYFMAHYIYIVKEVLKHETAGKGHHEGKGEQTSFVVDSCTITKDPRGYIQPMRVHSFRRNVQ